MQSKMLRFGMLSKVIGATLEDSRVWESALRPKPKTMGDFIGVQTNNQIFD